MDIHLDKTSVIPINEQLYLQISKLIESNRLHSNTSLPTVKELAKSFKLNYNTVAAVYRRLEREGYVTQNRRAGTRVAPQLPKKEGRVLEQHLASEFAQRLKGLNVNAEETLKLTLAQAALETASKPLRVAVVALRPLEAQQLAERYQGILGKAYVCVPNTPETYSSPDYAMTLLDPSLVATLQTLSTSPRYENFYSASFPAGAD